MKTLVLMAHSNPNDSAVNKKIKQNLEKEETVVYKDLKSLYSDFNFNVKEEQKALLDADKIVFQFPLYWFTAPSILKQYTDDIFTHDFAFKYDKNGVWQSLNSQIKNFKWL